MCGVWSHMPTFVYRNGKPHMGVTNGEMRCVGVQGERRGANLASKIPSPPCWEVPVGRGGSITPIQKTTGNKNLEGAGCVCSGRGEENRQEASR